MLHVLVVLAIDTVRFLPTVSAPLPLQIYLDKFV